MFLLGFFPPIINWVLLSGQAMAEVEAGSKMVEMTIMEAKVPTAAMGTREPVEATYCMQPVGTIQLWEITKKIKPI